MGGIIEAGNLQEGTAGWEVMARFSRPGAAFSNVDVVDGGGNILMHVDDGAMRLNNGQVLWKPVSESDGNLVILANGVSGLNIAEGEQKEPSGPQPLGLIGIGNGR